MDRGSNSRGSKSAGTPAPLYVTIHHHHRRHLALLHYNTIVKVNPIQSPTKCIPVMYRSFRNSPPPPPIPPIPPTPGTWTFQFSCGQVPHTRAKNPFKCPTARLNSVVKCTTSGPLFQRKSCQIWFGLKSIPAFFQNATNSKRIT